MCVRLPKLFCNYIFIIPKSFYLSTLFCRKFSVYRKEEKQMDFYERLTALMKERGLSHKMLENALGISNGSVSKWSKSTPNVKTLKKLEDYFGVTTDYLLTGEEKEKADYSSVNAKLTDLLRHDTELVKALQIYAVLPQSQKYAIINMINSYKSEE